MVELLAYKEVPLGGQYSYLTAKVSPEDFDRVMDYRWRGVCTSISGEVRVLGYIPSEKRTVRMPRFIMGVLDKNMDVLIDHKNFDTLDNTRGNLRVCTKSQNAANSVSRGGASVHKGVYWNKQRKRWYSKITHDYRQIFLGYFDDEIDAAQAYDKAALKHFGEFARLNLSS